MGTVSAIDPGFTNCCMARLDEAGCTDGDLDAVVLAGGCQGHRADTCFTRCLMAYAFIRNGERIS